MRRVLLAIVLLTACAGPPVAGRSVDPPGGGAAPPGGPTTGSPPAVRLLLAGDVMLGRGVAGIPDPFAGVRFQVGDADLAVANLESPLTLRPHDPASGPNALEAAPSSAALLADAGFDAMGVANNHAGDAGPQTVTDTLEALEAVGLVGVGGGTTAAEAFQARIVEVEGLRVALLAVDATGQGPHAGATSPGVARWDEDLVRDAVARARSAADVVAVGVHGGAEYVPTTDPFLARIARRLVGWGADVVWGHGPHVVQPIRVVRASGRTGIVATSLGNLVFDQHAPGTRRGAVLEVLTGAGGVRAFRVGTTEQRDGPVSFRGWRPPTADAVALDGDWWSLARPVEPVEPAIPSDLTGFEGDVLAAALGDPDGDGRTDAVVAFRRPFRATAVNALVPRDRLVDALDRTAHVGLYRPRDLEPRWVAGTVLRPVAALAACEGALAVGYSTLDGSEIVAAGAWRWGGFGFVPLPDLSGVGVPACADVDDDGLLDPLVLGRSSR